MGNAGELELVLSSDWGSVSGIFKSTEDGGVTQQWMTEEEAGEDRLWRCGEFLKDSIEEVPVIPLVYSFFHFALSVLMIYPFLSLLRAYMFVLLYAKRARNVFG